MRSYFLNTVLAGLAICAMASCTGSLEFDGEGNGAGDYSIDLSVICRAPGTRATDKAGEDRYNENKLDYVDWFIFRSDVDDAAALASGRGVPSGEYNAIETISLDDWVSAGQRSFYVYAVANIPTGIAGSHDDVPNTLAGLQSLEIAAEFNKDSFVSQDNFVMRGGQEVTFVDGDRNVTKKVNVQLARLASKVTVDLSIIPALDELITRPDGSQEYVQTWYPDLETVQVYLSFANGETTLLGDPDEYDMNQLFTYYRTMFRPSFSYLHIDKTQTPYVFDHTDAPAHNESLSQITLPGGAGAWDDTNLRWSIAGSPFYSYPMSWSPDSPQAPFLKVIVKWTSYDESKDGSVSPQTVNNPGGEDHGRFIRHQRSQDPGYIKEEDKEFYYKIPLVPITATSGLLEANDWLNICADLSILGSTSDDLPVTLTGQYYVAPWGTGTTSSGELKQASYLSLERYEYEFYAEDEMRIPVISSHDIVSYTMYDDGDPNTPLPPSYIDYSSASSSVERNLESGGYSYSFDFDGRNEYFTIRHALNKDLESSGVEVSPITYKFRVTNQAGLVSDVITVTQYPSMYIDTKASQVGSVFLDGFSSSYNKENYDYEFRMAGYGSNTAYNYLPRYDDGLGFQTVYELTVNSANTYTDPYGATVEFVNATTRNGYKDMTANSSILISVPENTSYWLYKVEYDLYHNNGYSIPTEVVDEAYISYSSNNNDWNPVSQKGVIKTFNASNNLKWWGEAKTLYVDFNTNYLVKKVKIYYHDKNLIGTIAHTSNTSANGTSANKNLYIISTTDVSPLGFHVSDARSSAPRSFTELTAAAGGTNSALTGYYPLDIAEFNHSSVAPQFIVGSQRGGSWGSGMRFESAVERCASYQENGYPAGRWRLPTDAEIQYIVKLSAAGKIPTLFNGTFWGSSGIQHKAVRVNPPNVEHQTDVPISETEMYIQENTYSASVRCVYDTWYWGDHPFNGEDGYANYMTTWSGWKTSK